METLNGSKEAYLQHGISHARRGNEAVPKEIRDQVCIGSTTRSPRHLSCPIAIDSTLWSLRIIVVMFVMFKDGDVKRSKW